ncbi:RRP12-like protein [Dendronephthya gigantea]|uniref:RRP12-like protein n=1 Tax=Dendronephthya gigantea TaxID=151771 RepID=UPI00106C2F12|nr:RRP12-like protein [Dendronephthya gigantea]
MVKIRKIKKKNWAKRQSCSSNPTIRSHRDAARQGFRQDRQSGSGLTVEALAIHNENIDDDGTVLDDAETTGRSMATVSISGLTDCSNPTFSGVLKRFWQSPGANHQEICAVLAAVTEVIRKNGGNETETEYFAALMTALETTEDDKSLSAIAFLLALVIKRVPQSVLQVKFSAICQVLLSILAVKSDSQSTALLKSLVTCLSTALKAQEAAIWSEPSTLKSYQGLLSFTVHPKPKVRKCSHESVAEIIRSRPNGSEFHPACQATSKFCIQELEKYKGTAQAVSVLHILGLLRNIMLSLPCQQVKSLCETMLKLMTFGNIMLSMNCMQVLHNMFEGNPGSTTVTSDLNGQLINALFDYQPNAVDEQQAIAWLTLMEKAYCSFQKLNAELCADSCVKLFSLCMTFLLSHHSVVRTTAANAMKCMLEECIAPVAVKLCKDLENMEVSTSPVLIILRCLESGLKLRYQESWSLILDVTSKFIQIFGKLCPERLKKCLISLCNLHNSHGIRCRKEIAKTVGTAFQTIGPKFVLSVVPLDLEKDTNVYEFPRSWLLPVMRDHVQETEMVYFFQKLLPLANSLLAKAENLRNGGSELEAKVLDTLSSQIWDLMPAFCTKPTDLIQNFKSVAKTLGSMLNERAELRPRICQTIRILISKNLDNEENIKELSRFAKNYLPILFNIYTSFEEKNDSISLPILQTLKCYLQITDQQLIKQFFQKAVEKAKPDETPQEKRHLLMDLVISMVQYLDKESVKGLYKTIVPWLKAKDTRLQKKSYRVLEEICSSKSADEFSTSHLTKIQDVLTKNLTTASSVSKAPRLRCLIQVVKKLQPGQEVFLNAIIPEVILSVKEVNSKARIASLKLLVEIAETYIRCSDQSTQACIENYLETLVAGFGGSPNMVSGTIIAISKIVYEYRGSYSVQVLDQLIKTLTNLLLSNKREVVKSALGFFKVAISVTSADEFAPFLQDLVSSLVNWNEDSRNKFRFKAQVLFERLIRKFGFKVIHGLVPEKHRKFVRNIHKRVERGKRKKSEGYSNRMKPDEKRSKIDSYEELMFGSDDENDDDDGETAFSTRKDQKSKKPPFSKAFIREDEPDEPLDLLSSSISQHVTATAPVNRRSRDSGFEVAEDGRLIIPEDKEESSKNLEKRLGSPVLSEDTEMEPPLKGNKRKMMEEDEMEDTFGKRSKHSGEFGEEYRAKKAGGDVKKKGKPDPYAYLPLNTQSLNKRKRAKMSGQFKGIVKGAKRGVQKSKKTNRRK